MNNTNTTSHHDTVTSTNINVDMRRQYNMMSSIPYHENNLVVASTQHNDPTVVAECETTKGDCACSSSD
jgi:hypothetical protein